MNSRQFNCSGQTKKQNKKTLWIIQVRTKLLRIPWPMVAVGLWYGQAYVIDNNHRCILLMGCKLLNGIIFINSTTIFSCGLYVNIREISYSAQ